MDLLVYIYSRDDKAAGNLLIILAGHSCTSRRRFPAFRLARSNAPVASRGESYDVSCVILVYSDTIESIFESSDKSMLDINFDQTSVLARSARPNSL